MSRDALSEQLGDCHEVWFDAHDTTYVSELPGLRIFGLLTGWSLGIAVGSGGFAAAMSIQMELDPSPAIPALARSRGIDGVSQRGSDADD